MRLVSQYRHRNVLRIASRRSARGHKAKIIVAAIAPAILFL